MPGKKPPESEAESQQGAISQHASDWIRRFLKQAELHFVDASQSLAPDADISEYQEATIQAVFQTLLDSGMTVDALLATMGQVAVEQHAGSTSWHSELNQRRFALIDREIQGTLTPDEKIELAGLTRIMRQHLESETNLPVKGAKELHRKLLELDGTDKRR